MTKCPQPRPQRGNTLAMIAALTILFLLVALFVMLYLMMVRSSDEHRTAIDSAALAAAKDVSRIVINTDQFGYVGLTSSPPTGTDTNAGDNYFQEVHGINELTATARVDMIVANEIGDTFLRGLAQSELDNVKAVKDQLTTEINGALLPAGTAKDAAGQTLTPYLSAERVYLKNQAKNSIYVGGSMRLTFGGIEGGIETATPAPTPLSKGACTGMESNGKYLSDMNVPFNGVDFVFGSVARRVGLCDKNKFRASVPGLPYQNPGVVLVEAQQRFQEQGRSWNIAYAGCACAGGTESPRPAPGAFTISFPDGPMPEFTCPGDIWGAALIQGKTMDVYQAAAADFINQKPPARLDTWSGALPVAMPAQATEVTKLAFYDWLRCGGSRINIDSVVGMQSMGFNAPSTPKIMWKATDPANAPAVQNLGLVPTGVIHIYTFLPDGTVRYISKDVKPYPYTVVGENQLYAEMQDGNELISAALPFTLSGVRYLTDAAGVKVGDIQFTPNYDLYVRDLTRRWGTISGGQHGGERMDGNPNLSLHSLTAPGAVELLPAEKLIARSAAGQHVGASQSAGNPDLIACLPEDDAPYMQTERGESGLLSGVISVATGIVSGLLSGPSSTNGTSTGTPGRGAPNPVSRQDDFASSSVPTPPYYTYSQGPAGGATRPAYQTNGLCCDIRFRRQLKVGDMMFGLGGYNVGYVGEMLEIP